MHTSSKPEDFQSNGSNHEDIAHIKADGILSTSEKQKRIRKPWVYRHEYERVKSEAAKWKLAFKAMAWMAATLLLIQIFGDAIIDLIIK